jgi:hypothetical protein
MPSQLNGMPAYSTPSFPIFSAPNTALAVSRYPSHSEEAGPTLYAPVSQMVQHVKSSVSDATFFIFETVKNRLLDSVQRSRVCLFSCSIQDLIGLPSSRSHYTILIMEHNILFKDQHIRNTVKLSCV